MLNRTCERQSSNSRASSQPTGAPHSTHPTPYGSSSTTGMPPAPQHTTKEGTTRERGIHGATGIRADARQERRIRQDGCAHRLQQRTRRICGSVPRCRGEAMTRDDLPRERHMTIILHKGSHSTAELDDCGDPKRCLFEAYNYLTRNEHTDACPPGVSRILHQ